MTGNDIAVRSDTLLTIHPGQAEFTPEQVSVLRTLGVKDATRGDLAVFFHVAARTGLDPFARQLYLIPRKEKGQVKQTIQTGIDGYRLIADRAAAKRGQERSTDEPLWCGRDGVWREVWLDDEPPAAARVVVRVGNAQHVAVAHWREYAQTYDGKPMGLWSKMPANQLAKCAEAAALRKAFPQDLSGVYTDDEMRDHDPEPARRSASSVLADPEPEPIEGEIVESEPESDDA